MNYKKQIDILVEYFDSNERNEKLIGIEIEHFILEQETLKAVSYYQKQGIEDILKELKKSGWEPIYEKEYLVGLNKKEAAISLEPGGQIELSIAPREKITDIEKIYFSFLKEIIPILEARNKVLYTIGYQPVSSINDIPILPKSRYKYMFKYFNDKGKYAHNMMKGTGSLHINIDFYSEKDYIKKNRIANFLSPFIYAIFDNSPFFEGNICQNPSFRALIWDNCDSDRCGLINNLFKSNFDYQNYAEYVLNTPLIISKNEDKLKFTDDKLFKEVFDPCNYSKNNIKHGLSMVFPDVRTKKYLEIRMSDSIPYPYNLGYVAFWKGLLYVEENVDYFYSQIKNYTEQTIKKVREQIKLKGIKANFPPDSNNNILEFFKPVLKLAKNGLTTKERKYLSVIEDMIANEVTPKMVTLKKLNRGKKEALNWCNINDIIKRREKI